MLYIICEIDKCNVKIIKMNEKTKTNRYMHIPVKYL